MRLRSERDGAVAAQMLGQGVDQAERGAGRSRRAGPRGGRSEAGQAWRAGPNSEAGGRV